MLPVAGPAHQALTHDADVQTGYLVFTGLQSCMKAVTTLRLVLAVYRRSGDQSRCIVNACCGKLSAPLTILQQRRDALQPHSLIDTDDGNGVTQVAKSMCNQSLYCQFVMC